MLRGVESAGMILAADRKGGKVAPVEPGAANPGDAATVEGIVSAQGESLDQRLRESAAHDAVGTVTYAGQPLRTTSGPVTCDVEDGARVR